MNLLSRMTRLAAAIVALGLVLFQAAPLSAAVYEEDVSNGDYLYLKGMVHSVSAVDKTLIVDQKKGSNITIRVSPATEFDGVRQLEELKASQVIKVWYRPGQDGNLGLKIQRLPDLGC